MLSHCESFQHTIIKLLVHTGNYYHNLGMLYFYLFDPDIS